MKKGMVFSFDVTVSIFLMIIILSTVIFFVSRQERMYFEKTPVIEGGRDIIRLLTQKNVLQSFNETLIATELSALLQPDLDMNIILEEYSPSYELQRTLTIGNETAKNRFVSGGNWYFANSTEYFKVRYKIWSKTERLSSTQ